MGRHRTDAEVRTTHRALIACGVLLGLAGAGAEPGAAVRRVGAVRRGRADRLPARAPAHRRHAGRTAGGTSGPPGRSAASWAAPTAGSTATTSPAPPATRGVRAAAPPGSGSGPAAPVTDYGWRGRTTWSRAACGSADVWRPRALAAGRAAANWRPQPRAVYSPWARGFGVVGPQGSGKTQFLVNVVLDAPGAAVVPSTKPELVVLTRAAARAGRADRGVQPVAARHDRSRTSAGTRSPAAPTKQTADRRAWALVRGSGGAAGIDRADFWAGKAQEILRCYLLAAALEVADMDPGDALGQRPRRPGTGRDPRPPHPHLSRPGWLPTLLHPPARLAEHPHRLLRHRHLLRRVHGLPDRRRRRAGPGPGGAFDVEAFLRWRGTLYLVGGAGDTPVGAAADRADRVRVRPGPAHRRRPDPAAGWRRR